MALWCSSLTPVSLIIDQHLICLPGFFPTYPQVLRPLFFILSHWMFSYFITPVPWPGGLGNICVLLYCLWIIFFVRIHAVQGLNCKGQRGTLLAPPLTWSTSSQVLLCLFRLTLRVPFSSLLNPLSMNFFASFYYIEKQFRIVTMASRKSHSMLM